MRILGFATENWINFETGRPKLWEDKFTTWRFKRQDRDWEVGEVVQVVVKPRTPGREVLGQAMIIARELRPMPPVLELASLAYMEEDARRDGFLSYPDMWDWLYKTHGDRLSREPMNKLTLAWC